MQNGSISIPGVVTDPTCATLPIVNQFYSCGEGPGGNVTGMTNLNGDTYVVTDNGGLYQIHPNVLISELAVPSSSLIPNRFVTTNYIGNSDDLVGINFQGLTRGPQSTETNRYANMLFAIDNDGQQYALNVAAGANRGKLTPIFEDGAVSVDTGVPEARGLAFTSLEENQWHVTPDLPAVTERQAQIGHGIEVAFDGSRLGGNALRPGRQSYHFGGTNFPGGAYGTVISNEFNLKGYTAADLPTVFFNYYADGGNLASRANHHHEQRFVAASPRLDGRLRRPGAHPAAARHGDRRRYGRRTSRNARR